MKAIDKLTKARIEIQFKNPFFAYLSLFLKFREDKGEIPEIWDEEKQKKVKIAGAGINIKGDFVYCPEYIENLTIEETEGLILHELLHLALLHLSRKQSRDKNKWNIATDICVNQVVKDNNFTLPKDTIVSDDKNQIVLFEKTPFKQTITDTHKKTAEELFNEIQIPNMPSQSIVNLVGQESQEEQGNGKSGDGKDGEKESGEGEGNKNEEKSDGKGDGKENNSDDEGKSQNQGKNKTPKYQGFDYHYDTQETDGNITEKEKKEFENEWKNRIEEALAVSKMRGTIPAGIERLIGELHKEQINWKVLLYRYITKQIPYDYSWAKPSKKSISVGTYMPHIQKEKIEIVVGIDLSGSIGQKETNDFISEIIGMAKAFKERLSVRLITHDVEVCDDYKVDNGNIKKIKQIKIRGGGGTSHIPIFDYIKEKEKKSKCAIFFTDGYSDLDRIEFQKYPFDKLFVISKDGDGRQVQNRNCEVINLKE